MTPEMRSTHLYCCGSTGTGKSKMLEHLIRQDIQNWYKTKCGALIIDPHGSLYNSLINWISWNAPHLKEIPIVPIETRPWVVSVCRPDGFGKRPILCGLAMREIQRNDGNSGLARKGKSFRLLSFLEGGYV
jgi:hypothetical protein